jgi:hypothetical protein
MEFLYKYVYVYRFLGSESRFNIHDFFLEGRCLRVPLTLPLLRGAIDRKISNLWLETENTLRAQKGMPKVGEGWSSEARLVSQLRDVFPDVRIDTQARPSWLGRMRFDAYFPEFNIAVEYQGTQHNEAVTLFGGQSGLVTTQARDELKRKLCVENDCSLIEVFPDYDLTKVVDAIRALMTVGPRLELPSRPQKIAVAPRRARSMSQGKNVTLAVVKPKRINIAALGAHDINECARHGTDELIRSLAAAGTNFETLQKKKQDSLIFVAASAGNLNTLRAFLDLGLNVNAENCNRKATALARLCNGWQGNPNLDAVKMLLNAGADVTKCAKGYLVTDHCAYAPPLIGAAIACNIPLADLLLRYGAKINGRHKESRHTPFTAACSQDHRRMPTSEERLSMLRWLIKKGANPRARDLRGRNAFEIAIERWNRETPDLALYRYLMRLKIPLHLEDWHDLNCEYEIAPTPELRKIIAYAHSGRRKRLRRK